LASVEELEGNVSSSDTINQDIHLYRTHTCNELREKHIGSRVRLSGWIHNRRDHGGVLFIDLRDNYGITQVVIYPEQQFQKKLAHVTKETVVRFDGIVAQRSAENVNPKLPTGAIELVADGYEILSACEATPFSVFPEDPIPEEMRLEYRYMYLRRSTIHQNILLR